MESPSSSESPPRQRQQRRLKNLLLDRAYQIRSSVISVLLAALLCLCLGLLVIWQMRTATHFYLDQRKQTTLLLQQQRKKTTQTLSHIRRQHTQELQKVLQTANAMLDVQLKDKNPDVREAAQEAKKALESEDKALLAQRRKTDQTLLAQRRKANQTLLTQRKRLDREAAQQRQHQERMVILFLLLFCLFVVALLFFFHLLLTHKVAGPLFKISRYFDQLSAGHFPPLDTLRRGDLLHHFFERFQKMYSALEQRQRQELALLQDLRQSCHEQDPKSPLLPQLDQLIAEKEKSLDKPAPSAE
jgi:nitrogen fixation/metabolism regulation signal transduction histidine kinase